MPEAQPQKGHRAAWTGAAAETIAQPQPAPTAQKHTKQNSGPFPPKALWQQDATQRPDLTTRNISISYEPIMLPRDHPKPAKRSRYIHDHLSFKTLQKQAVPVRTMTLLQSFIQLGERFMTVHICDISNHFRNRKREVVSIPYSTIKRGLCGDSISPSLISSI